MKILILRIFAFTLFSLIVLQETHAQRGRGRDRYYRRDYVHPNSYWNQGRNHYNRGWNYRGYQPYRWRNSFNIGFGGPRVIIPFGGINFHYSNEYYYRPYGSDWRIVTPPIGMRIHMLPRGYYRVYGGNLPYYYYGGAYYREQNNEYEVVDAPMGASVPELPSGAKAVVINRQKFYELQGTYYKEDIRGNSEIWYTVVGKDGKLDTEEIVEIKDTRPAIGDMTDKLPDNCRTVTVNGHKYFVSLEDVYYEEVVDGKNVRYKVVGK